MIRASAAFTPSTGVGPVIAQSTMPQRISEYLVDRRIGITALGELWLAHHHIWADQHVVITVPHDPGLLSRLSASHLAGNGLNHPNILRAVGMDPYADPPYLITEHAAGHTLDTFLEIEPMPAGQAIDVIRQVLQALAQAHRHGLVHANLKAQNIILIPGTAAGEPNVKVANFGLGENLSATHAVPPTAQADLQACVALFFEMLTGTRPMARELPGELEPSVPAAVDAMVSRWHSLLDTGTVTAEGLLETLIVPHPEAIGAMPLEAQLVDAPANPRRRVQSSRTARLVPSVSPHPFLGAMRGAVVGAMFWGGFAGVCTVTLTVLVVLANSVLQMQSLFTSVHEIGGRSIVDLIGRAMLTGVGVGAISGAVAGAILKPRKLFDRVMLDVRILDAGSGLIIGIVIGVAILCFIGGLRMYPFAIGAAIGGTMGAVIGALGGLRAVKPSR